MFVSSFRDILANGRKRFAFRDNNFGTRYVMPARILLLHVRLSS